MYSFTTDLFHYESNELHEYGIGRPIHVRRMFFTTDYADITPNDSPPTTAAKLIIKMGIKSSQNNGKVIEYQLTFTRTSFDVHANVI